ncbi:protein of unknown function [Georgfuchsia toluolica]|uniref:Uncharacterized protein n=1 Tax=Georgfuchsia toluolica TaxID=424218 RepID=A0A916N9G4_9PROT|nr:hypothetical protein [Georgfuchsia toluolica]CAG4884532.1 protein of unknown function [Georgfuchsia toluolica]
MKSILDRSFHYTSSAKTDIKKTFARIRRIEREKQAAQAKADAGIISNVQSISQNKKITLISK